MKLLVIGGTGSLGSALVRHFIQDENVLITVFSRDPHKQIALQNEVGSGVIFILGDICDYTSIREACDGQDFVVHTAALKHVHLGETEPNEFIRVNIHGTENVVRASRDAHVQNALFISSDKAVDPINLYGRTKAIGEGLFRQYLYPVLRYGNVVDSEGAFTHIWRKSIRDGESVIVRKPIPSRFYMTLDKAVSLVEETMNGNKLYIPANLSTFRINDVAESLGIKYVFGNLLPGEKQDEVLLSQYEQGSQISDTLCEVRKGDDGYLDREQFSSATAYRMTYEEIIDAFWHLIME